MHRILKNPKKAMMNDPLKFLQSLAKKKKENTQTSPSLSRGLWPRQQLQLKKKADWEPWFKHSPSARRQSPTGGTLTHWLSLKSPYSLLPTWLARVLPGSRSPRSLVLNLRPVKFTQLLSHAIHPLNGLQDHWEVEVGDGKATTTRKQYVVEMLHREKG